MIFWKKKKVKPQKPSSTPSDIAAFYNTYHKQFKKVYGNVIQAFRTNNLENLLNYEFNSAGFNKGDKLIDAGCGVCGPAIHFAKEFKVQIDAISVSDEQVKEAEEEIIKNQKANYIKVHHKDYHQMSSFLEQETYDGVYFLESFGHSFNKKILLDETWKMLKPGGICYIKDLFLKEPIISSHKEKIDYEVGRINESYKYDVSDLYEVLKIIRKKGFILNFVKTIDLDINDFENLAISNEFQELTGISKIDNWEEYIFPVDFFEIKITKPIHDLSDGLNRYFLQNLYYLQVKGEVPS